MNNIKDIINSSLKNEPAPFASHRGKFIVIDGTDGSGKATQTQLLADRLSSAGFQVEIADFPQYNTKSAGLIEEYLSGKYGNPDDVGPYRASIFYACDRYDASLKIKEWLNEGKIVVCNRYVTANMGHQGGKIDNAFERKAYFEWLYRIEYELFEIPKPDLNIILHVNAEIAQKLSQNRPKIDWAGKTNDIHQNDINHLKKAENVYLEIAKSFPDFILIECTRNGEIMEREEINDLVWQSSLEIIAPLRRPYHTPNFKDLYNQSQEAAEKKEKERILLTVQKTNNTAKLPAKTNENEPGLELFACDYYSILPGRKITVNTGLKIFIPEGYIGLIADKNNDQKSGIHTIGGIMNSSGRSQVIVGLINLSQDIYNISPGQKIAQLIIQKAEQIDLKEIEIGDNPADNNSDFGFFEPEQNF